MRASENEASRVISRDERAAARASVADDDAATGVMRRGRLRVREAGDACPPAP